MCKAQVSPDSHRSSPDDPWPTLPGDSSYVGTSFREDAFASGNTDNKENEHWHQHDTQQTHTTNVDVCLPTSTRSPRVSSSHHALPPGTDVENPFSEANWEPGVVGSFMHSPGPSARDALPHVQGDNLGAIAVGINEREAQGMTIHRPSMRISGTIGTAAAPHQPEPQTHAHASGHCSREGGADNGSCPWPMGDRPRFSGRLSHSNHRPLTQRYGSADLSALSLDPASSIPMGPSHGGVASQPNGTESMATIGVEGTEFAAARALFIETVDVGGDTWSAPPSPFASIEVDNGMKGSCSELQGWYEDSISCCFTDSPNGPAGCPEGEQDDGVLVGSPPSSVGVPLKTPPNQRMDNLPIWPDQFSPVEPASVQDCQVGEVMEQGAVSHPPMVCGSDRADPPEVTAIDKRGESSGASESNSDKTVTPQQTQDGGQHEEWCTPNKGKPPTPQHTRTPVTPTVTALVESIVLDFLFSDAQDGEDATEGIRLEQSICRRARAHPISP
eukprot:evm.model.scf_1692.6 EVM.evm.TU.scf_1692.6   scf_1692:31302-33042(-)